MDYKDVDKLARVIKRGDRTGFQYLWKKMQPVNYATPRMSTKTRGRVSLTFDMSGDDYAHVRYALNQIREAKGMDSDSDVLLSLIDAEVMS